MLPHKFCDAFLAVIETGSFEQAAVKLCITASAVTLRIQGLEKQLGNTLLLRERPCRVTAAGQIVLEHLQHQRLMQQNLLQQLHGQQADSSFYKLNIASNADSLETWLLPSIRNTLLEQRIQLNLMIDDQSRTHELMETGAVNACISSEASTMKGCITHRLGAMRYQMVATAEFIEHWFKNGIHRDAFRKAPAVIYNDKDRLHSDLMLKLFGLNMQGYPYHFIPSSTSFVEAIRLGLGFGIVPEMQIQQSLASGQLQILIPEAETDVMLYWHQWKQQSAPLHALTECLVKQAQQVLIQL